MQKTNSLRARRHVSITNVLMIVAILLSIMVVGPSLAYLLDEESKPNYFTVGKPGIAIVENNTQLPNLGGIELGSGTTQKSVKVINTQTIDQYIRVAIVPTWKGVHVTDVGEFPASITGNTYSMGDVTFTLNANWSDIWDYPGDGYFYLKRALPPGETTPELLQSVTNTYTGSKVLLRIDILAQSIQTSAVDSATNWSALYEV